MGSCLKNCLHKKSQTDDSLYQISDGTKLIPDSRDSSSSMSSHNTSTLQNASLEDFKRLKVLGKGSFGKVVLVQLNEELFAMKILKKEVIIKRKQIDHTKTERELLEKLNNPFIVKLHYAFQDEKKLYFVTDFMQGGELFYHLRRHPLYKDQEVIFYASELICAINYMHSNNYMYRDLKPENILIDKYGHVKITDFGLSKILEKHDAKAYTLCGTAAYLAPEILFDKGYDKTCDWFSLGVLIFEMLCGYHPYQQKNNQIDLRVYSKKLKMPKLLSAQAKDVIEKLLQPDPKHRLGYHGAEEIMNHKYFSKVDFQKVYYKEYEPPFVPELKKENDLRYFDVGFTSEKVESYQHNVPSWATKEDFGGFSYQPNVVNKSNTPQIGPSQNEDVRNQYNEQDEDEDNNNDNNHDITDK